MPGNNRKVTFLDRVRAVVPENQREAVYRFVGGLGLFLFAFGVLDDMEASLWTQLGVSTVTLLFALLYATSTWRVALYAVVGPLGAVLMAYSIVTETRWGLIVAATGQALGITTAAAKTVQRAPSPPVIDSEGNVLDP